MNDFDVKTDVERDAFRPLYIWIPLIIFVVFLSIMLILKFNEKSHNSFTSWGYVIFWCITILLLSFFVSISCYLLFSFKVKKPVGVEFNGREFCDNKIRNEIRDRFGYNLHDFFDTGDSDYGVAMAGKNGQEQMFHCLYRVQRNNRKRYILAVMNMTKNKEDLIRFKHSPMNFANVDELIEKMCNSLSSNPEKYDEHEETFTDRVTGRQEIKKSKVLIRDNPELEDD